jgi:cystathionine beta-lyase family protein involved in aluminum resistance
MINISQYLEESFHISPALTQFVLECEEQAQPYFARYGEIAQINQFKVIEALKKNRVSSRHFYPSTGYGYGDEGREKLCQVFADVFGANRAIVSPLLMSGTHAISIVLFGLLRPNDAVLSLTGNPYDTLRATICGTSNSLDAFDISFYTVPLCSDEKIDLAAARQKLLQHPNIKMVYIQRSTGYELRSAFSTDEIAQAIAAIRLEFPDLIFMVDNCYGEFVCVQEPTQMGADIIAGSLIKNPGGGLAPSGGYIAGREDLIESIAYRFSAPGVGMEIGSYAYGYQLYFQGLFLAPHIVLQALLGVILAAAVFGRLGYQTNPTADAIRGDITQTICFGSEEPLTAFVRGIQRASAIDAHVVPYAWDMPGYDDKVIMAAGTFVQGASIELTADAPMRPPYAAYLQGALTYEHAKLGILFALDELRCVDTSRNIVGGV